MSVCKELGAYLPYFRAVYKGVPFDVLSVQDESSRRIAIGTFPYSEVIRNQDIGRSAQKYTLTGRAYGQGHRAEAAILKKVFNSPNPGWLVHPTLGVIYVSVLSANFSNDLLNSPSITRFNVSFIEANPSKTSLLGGAVTVGIGDLLDGLYNGFSNIYSPNGAALAQVAKYGTFLMPLFNNLFKKVGSASPVKAISSSLASLTQDPKGSTVSSFILGTMQYIHSASIPLMQKIAAFDDILTFNSSVSIAPDYTSKITNVLSIASASIFLSDLLVQRDFDTMGDADNALNRAVLYIDQTINNFKNFDLLDLQELFERFRVNFIHNMNQKIYSAPNLTTFRFSDPLTRYSAIWQLYKNAEDLDGLTFVDNEFIFGVGQELSLYVTRE